MERSEREKLAWAAGFFDGEGSIWPHKSRASKDKFYPNMTMEVAQSGEHAVELLEKFRDAVGIGKIYGPYYKKCAVKPIYRWCTSSLGNCQAVYAKLWAFLGPYKKQQITNAVTPILERYRAKVHKEREENSLS